HEAPIWRKGRSSVHLRIVRAIVRNLDTFVAIHIIDKYIILGYKSDFLAFLAKIKRRRYRKGIVRYERELSTVYSTSYHLVIPVLIFRQSIDILSIFT